MSHRSRPESSSQAERSARWRQNNPEKAAKASRDWQARNRGYVQPAQRERRRVSDEAKSVPCADCHQTFPIICMDFDHVRGEKIGNVADMVKSNKPLALIVAEIAKCDVVCANCHRIRTAARYDA